MKKSILILTDLSDNAKPVAETALNFASLLNKNLVLLNCHNTTSTLAYPLVPVINGSGSGHEDRNSTLKLISDHLIHQFTDSFPGKSKPTIKLIIREGSLHANVKNLLNELPIELIAMGAQSVSSAKHFLFGSDTKIITDTSPIPVLIIPSAITVRPPKVITFATNFLEQDANSLCYLMHLREQLGAQLEIVHIRQYGQDPKPKNAQVQDLIKDACSTKSPLVLYNEVYGKDVVSRLNHYCKENDSDIIALSHAHHSLLFRMLAEGIVDKSLSEHRVPLLIIPELKSNSKTQTNIKIP